MSKNLFKGLLTYFILGLLVILLTLVFGESLTRGNKDALNIMVTVFSILAGIMIAVITVLGDPSALYGGSWRIANAHHREIRRRLGRLALLFYVYLMVIG